MKLVLLLVALSFAPNNYAASEVTDSDREEVITLCWAASSVLGIIGREDGQSLVEQMFKDQAHAWWNVGIEFGISPLDPRYTETRDGILAEYRAEKATYEGLMEMSSSCGEVMNGR